MITMTPRALRYYHKSRKPYYSKCHGRLFPGGTALHSRRNAIYRDKVETEFDNLEHRGLVKFVIEPYHDCNWDDLEGDTYDVDMHEDTVPGGGRTIKAQQKEFRRSVEDSGVFGLVGYALGEQVDSCWGFAGEYDEDFAGYATGIKAAAVQAVYDSWEDDQSGEH